METETASAGCSAPLEHEQPETTLGHESRQHAVPAARKQPVGRPSTVCDGTWWQRTQTGSREAPCIFRGREPCNRRDARCGVCGFLQLPSSSALRARAEALGKLAFYPCVDDGIQRASVAGGQGKAGAKKLETVKGRLIMSLSLPCCSASHE
eukprot:601365-Hanusia_phi.AAC.2